MNFSGHCLHDSEMCSPPIIPNGTGWASQVLSFSMMLWLDVSHECKCWGDHHGLRTKIDDIVAKRLTAFLKIALFQICTGVPNFWVIILWEDNCIARYLIMVETPDCAFCPKMNSDPRLVCVSFLCGYLSVVQLGFFFPLIVLDSFFPLFLHCHSCFLFGITY